MKDIDMYELKVVKSFSAAHQLSIPNKKCENLHGHNWKVEVYVVGKNLEDTGILVDFGVIKKNLGSIIEELDHQFLNTLESFDGISPSSENIATYILKQLETKISTAGVSVSKVTVWESENACATYYPDKS